jgi:hypothetical protein
LGGDGTEYFSGMDGWADGESNVGGWERGLPGGALNENRVRGQINEKQSVSALVKYCLKSGRQFEIADTAAALHKIAKLAAAGERLDATTLEWVRMTFASLGAHATKKINRANARSVAMILWAYAKIGERPPVRLQGELDRRLVHVASHALPQVDEKFREAAEATCTHRTTRDFPLISRVRIRRECR